MRHELIASRKAAGLTQQQLAKMVGIDRSYIAHIEKGKKMPSLSIAIKIAEVLKVPVEILFASSIVSNSHKIIAFNSTGTDGI